jgi:TRAP-type C4-dicarboxylate transport system permease small subunit
MRLLNAADQAVAWFCKYASIVLLLLLFTLLGLAIVVRMLPFVTIEGYDEFVELAFIWITVLTTIALWREGALYRVAVIENLLPHAAQVALEVLINLSMLAFAGIMIVYGWEFMVGSGETTPFLRMDRAYWYAALPFAGVFMGIYSLVWIWRVLRGRARLASNSTLVG